MSRFAMIAATALMMGVAFPAAAQIPVGPIGDPAQHGSGIILGTPIVLHNYLHFQQEGERIHAEYEAAMRAGGGQLSATDRALLTDRYNAYARDVNAWVADGQRPAKILGSNIPRRSFVTAIGRPAKPLALIGSSPALTPIGAINHVACAGSYTSKRAAPSLASPLLSGGPPREQVPRRRSSAGRVRPALRRAG